MLTIFRQASARCSRVTMLVILTFRALVGGSVLVVVFGKTGAHLLRLARGRPFVAVPADHGRVHDQRLSFPIVAVPRGAAGRSSLRCCSKACVGLPVYIGVSSHKTSGTLSVIDLGWVYLVVRALFGAEMVAAFPVAPPTGAGKGRRRGAVSPRY